MADTSKFDVIIIGGGIAGLSLAVLQAKANSRVLLIEKADYPRHKVCGEYISLESWEFIERLGIPLREMQLSVINKLRITAQSGLSLSTALDLGGFGLSRYLLEEELYKLALSLGVEVMTNTTYLSHQKENSVYYLKTTAGTYCSTVLCGAFGKYAPRSFYRKHTENQNWVGVKYHIRHEHPKDEIVLHSFDGGYCGMSKIEHDKSCLCYIVSSDKLNAANNNVVALEQQTLRKNPHLDKIFAEARFLFDQPMIISNVTFDIKKPTHDGVFYIGDSAGTIAPLSGNGMSNAFRSAFLLNKSLSLLQKGQLNLPQTLVNYHSAWHKAFAQRIKTGRVMHHFFCKPTLNTASIRILKYANPIHKFIIRQTHGKSF